MLGFVLLSTLFSVGCGQKGPYADVVFFTVSLTHLGVEFSRSRFACRYFIFNIVSAISQQYPRISRLNEAIRLAASTVAATELVSAFSIFPKERLEAFATSELDQLTISLHTKDRRRYREIFGHGDFDAFTERLARLRSIQKRLRLEKPTLDFAFVAMKQNLDQLRDVAAFAASMGGAKLDIHPVIRRDETPFHFYSELENGRLKPAYIKELQEKICGTREKFSFPPMDASTGEICIVEICKTLHCLFPGLFSETP